MISLEEKTFSPAQHLAANPGLVAHFQADPDAAFEHLLACGIREGRQTTQGFDAAQYLANYADLQQAFGADLAAATRHWIVHGSEEGRSYEGLLIGGLIPALCFEGSPEKRPPCLD